MEEVIKVADRNGDRIMDIPGVCAFGVSLDDEGYHLKAYLSEDVTLPQEVEGIRLLKLRTGRFVGLAASLDVLLPLFRNFQILMVL